MINPLFSDLESERKELEYSAKLQWFHWTILAISLCLTLFVWYFLHTEELQRNKLDFEIEANQTLELISERMQKYEDALQSGVATITALDYQVSQSEWQRFSKSLNIENRYPGINGIGLIKEILPEDLADYLQVRRAEFSKFEIYPKHPHPTFWPITYIEPLDENREALGLDVAHESNRYSTALKAKQTGLPKITAPIVLVQDQQKTPGFLFYKPFYTFSSPQNGGMKGGHFAGIVYAPFIVERLMHGAMDQKNRRISFRLLDQGRVLFDELKSNNLSYDKTAQFKQTKKLSIYGRVWTFEIWSNKLFNQSRPTNKAWIILVGGSAVNLLLLAFFYYLSRSYRRAVKLSKATFDFHQFRDFYFSSVVDNVNEGLITIDTKGIIQTVNPACLELFGYQKNELVGENIKILMPSEIANKHDQYLTNYRETGIKNVIGSDRELLAQTKSGELLPVELCVSEIEINGMTFYSGILRDLTEKEKHKNELLEAVQFQKEIINNIPDILFVKNERFEIIRANQAFLSMYPEDMRDKVIGYTTLESYTEKESEAFLEFDKMALDKGSSETEETIKFPDGITRTLYTKKTRFYSPSGEVFILGLARDVTELRKSREKIILSNKQLDEFAYIASHDLKEPLRGIYNHASFFLEDHKDVVNEEGRHKLDRIIFLAKKMENLISDLLYYSRLGRDEVAIVETDLNLVIDDISEVLGEDSSVDIVCPRPLPTIKCDKIRIREAFNNLITNGIKYNESTNKLIEIGVHEQSSLESGRRYVFYVKDNGIGIDEKFHKDIFRIFKRLHGVEAYGGGTGAGLTFVEKIVKSHGGRVWLDSKRGQGSTFYFSIIE